MTVKKKTKKKPIKKPPRTVKKRAVGKIAKKTARVKPRKKGAAPVKKGPQGIVLGKITHYFPKVQAAVIKLKLPLSVGDAVAIKGHTTDFTQTITSMQVDHQTVQQAKKNQEIGGLVNSRVRQHDVVYKV